MNWPVNLGRPSWPSLGGCQFARLSPLLIGLEQTCEDGVVYTVVLFAAIGTALPPAWGHRSFWISLALIFIGHTIILLVVLQAFPPRQFGIPKLLLIPAGAIEGTFIAGTLWKRMRVLRASEPRS